MSPEALRLAGRIARLQKEASLPGFATKSISGLSAVGGGLVGGTVGAGAGAAAAPEGSRVRGALRGAATGAAVGTGLGAASGALGGLGAGRAYLKFQNGAKVPVGLLDGALMAQYPAAVLAGAVGAPAAAAHAGKTTRPKEKKSHDLRRVGQLARLHKEGSKALTGKEALEHAIGFAMKIPKIVTGTASDAGKRVTRAAALNPDKPGLAAKLMGKAVQYSPHAALVAGGAHVLSDPARDYMRAKNQQFRARQAQTRPYYDPTTGRFS